jgi:poly(3-hydroxybutyrate) depolymerase
MTRANLTVIGMLIVSMTSGLAHGADLPAGSGMFAVADPPGSSEIRVFYHRPQGMAAQSPILFVMHGVQRDADVYRDNWVRLAEQYTALVLVPEFSRARFPTDESYNLGNMVNAAGAPNPIADWSFPIIERVFDHVRQITGNQRQGYILFGHSAGAQFAHRLVTFMPENRAERVIVANAGWYTLPLADATFPYGLGGLAYDDARLRIALSRPLTLLLGEVDNDPRHRFLRNTPEAVRQGPRRPVRLAAGDRAGGRP